SEMALQPGSEATRFRAGHSRARGTFDKPTTPESANDIRPPRTVRWAREWSGRAPTWMRDKPVKARGEPVLGRERPAPARPLCVCNWGNRWAVSATLVRLKGKVELRVSGHICGGGGWAVFLAFTFAAKSVQR